MKTLPRWFTGVLLILSLQSPNAIAGGYVNKPFATGYTLFANPLQSTDYWGTVDNRLSTLFPTVPQATTVWLWNSTTFAFDSPSTFDGASWSLDLTLDPGTGALLHTWTPFTNTFVGQALAHDGSPITGDPPFPLPPPYGGPGGIFLVADKTPYAYSPTSAANSDFFLHVLGRLPDAGEQIISLTQTSTYSSFGGGTWSAPHNINVADALFVNIGPVTKPAGFPVLPVAPMVPEPSTVALALLAFAALGIRQRPRG